MSNRMSFPVVTQALNGLEGRTAFYNEAKGRYDVKLKDGRVVSVAQANLIDLGASDI